MARLTVERCKYDHFELVAIAAERAKQLISGAMPTVPKGKDKFPVVALREIEAGHIDREKMKETIINKFQTRGNHDNIDEDEGQKSASEDDEDDGYESDDNDFSADFQGISEEEFDSDNIFSDDISENEDKI